jgi:hypothetical protein
MATTLGRRLRRAKVGWVLVALVGSAVATHAYVTNGHVWKSHQVPYYVNPVNLDIPETDIVTAVQSGAANWPNQSRADFSFSYSGRSSATAVASNSHNDVFFRNESNGSTIAVTYWWYDGTGYLVDADILFYDGGFAFFGNNGTCSAGQYVQDIATHEFGHALGLKHTDVTTATMYPSTTSCSQGWRSLDTDDVAGVEALYGTRKTVPPAAPTAVRVVAEVISWLAGPGAALD